MLKGQDVVVLLMLLGRTEPVGARQLAAELGFNVAGTQRALRRLDDAWLRWGGCAGEFTSRTPEEFLIHAVKFCFPARRGGEAPGIPTSWAAEPLKGELAATTDLPPVWPHALGKVRGLVFEPLHPMVPDAAKSGPELAERLALIDALRSREGVRVRNLAERLLKERIDVEAGLLRDHLRSK
jgi:hypothetical protein